jgi:hypothetical protein
MPFDLPNTPAVNDTANGPGGQVYKWDGVKWITVVPAPNMALYQTPWVTNIDGASHSLINVSTLTIGAISGSGFQMEVTGQQPKTSVTGSNNLMLASSDALASNPLMLEASVIGNATAASMYARLQCSEYGTGNYHNICLNESGGLVGIGTTSPYAKLTVNGGNVSVFSATASSVSAPLGASLYLGDSNFNSATYWNQAPGLTSVYDAGPAVAGALAFYTYSGGARAERIRIIASGAVGVGKTNPAYALDVTGDINTTGQFRVNGTPFTGGGSPGGSAGMVQWNNGSAFAGSGNLYWDNNNIQLGIGTSTPLANLFVTTDLITQTYRGIVTAQYYTGAHAACLWFIKGRGTRAAPATVAVGDFPLTILPGLSPQTCPFNSRRR